MRGGNRARTHVYLTLNPVFFHYLVPPLLAVRWHSQSLGRKAAHAGGRSQEQLKLAGCSEDETYMETSPSNR